MAKENRILAVDVGEGKIKAAEFFFPGDGSILMTRFACNTWEQPEASNEEGENVEIEEGVLFAQCFRQLLAANKFTAKDVRLSLSGQSSFQRLSKLPPMVGNRSAINRVVAFEASQTVPYSMDEVEWDYQLIHHEWDETHTEEQEDGTTQEVVDHQEEFEALFVAMKSDQLRQYTDVIEDCGLNLLSVEIAPIALFNAALAAQVKDDECVLLVNIGGRGTSLMIADHKRAFIRNIPIAGDTITNQIAKEFNVGFREADELKKRYGFVSIGGAYEDPESEMAATISKIARHVMTRLHGEISRSVSVWRAQHGGSAATRVLLSGGGSVMPYMMDFFQEKLRLPVEFLNSFPIISIGKDVDKQELQKYAPMAQELIGMSIRNITHCPIDISLLPKSIRLQRDLSKKMPYFYASALALIICMVIVVFGVIALRDYGKRRVERAQERVEKVNKKQEEINGIFNELNRIKGEYDEVRQFLAARNAWGNMLTELQGMIPNAMWLVTLEGYGDSMITPQGITASSDEESATVVAAASSDPSKHATIDDASNLLEVKKLHLVGYTIVPRNQQVMLEEEFRQKLKNSEHFTEDWNMTECKPSSDGLTYFDVTLTLKTPIKK